MEGKGRGREGGGKGGEGGGDVEMKEGKEERGR